MKRLRLIGNTGDTIVEVLIAIAVVGSVLAGAYVSASRSLTGSRQSQERGEALKLIEGQTELLKLLGTSNSSTIYTHTGSFCISSAPAVVPATDPACNNASFGIAYALQINRLPSPNNNTFEVKAVWPRAGGGGYEEAKIVYRVYPR